MADHIMPAVQTLDEYMSGLSMFNPHAVNRSKWQTGLYQDSSKKYWFKVPMFLRLGDDEESPDPPAKLHRWVRAADKRSDMYRANPARPEVWARTANGTTTPIEKTKERVLQLGDAVVVAFMVRYQVNRTWGPQLLLKEITCVMPRASVPGIEHAAQPITVPVVDTTKRSGMVDGEFVPGEWRCVWPMLQWLSRGDVKHVNRTTRVDGCNERTRWRA